MSYSSLSNKFSSWPRKLRGLVAALVVVAVGMFVCLPAHGQFETASVLGYVHDGSGAAIPNAKVTLVNVATGVEVTVERPMHKDSLNLPACALGSTR